MHIHFLERDIGALFQRLWVQTATQTLTPGVDITPAGLLVAVTAITVAVCTILGAIILRVMDDRFKARDEKRAESDLEVKSNARLIEAILVLGQGVKDNNAASVKEREELRTMLETKSSAKDGRAGAVEKINLHTDEAADDTQTKINIHTDEAIQSLRNDLTNAQQAVEAAAVNIQKAVTFEQMQAAIAPLEKLLERVSASVGDVLRDRGNIQQKIDSNRLNPQVAIDAEKARGITDGKTSA